VDPFQVLIDSKSVLGQVDQANISTRRVHRISSRESESPLTQGDVINVDVLSICRRIGLKEYELAALLGTSHTTISKTKARKRHHPTTVGLYWILQHLSKEVIPVLLERWLHERPKTEEQVRILLQIAGRFLPPREARVWQRVVRRKYSEFFF
jgi:transcriptional regulator with XRE-family HTH domain